MAGEGARALIGTMSILSGLGGVDPNGWHTNPVHSSDAEAAKAELEALRYGLESEKRRADSAYNELHEVARSRDEAIAERDALREWVGQFRKAGQAVVDAWGAPDWVRGVMEEAARLLRVVLAAAATDESLLPGREPGDLADGTLIQARHSPEGDAPSPSVEVESLKAEIESLKAREKALLAAGDQLQHQAAIRGIAKDAQDAWLRAAFVPVGSSKDKVGGGPDAG